MWTLNSTIFLFVFDISVDSELGTKQEGEVCGSCFNPENNFFCGTCVSDLKCIKDSQNNLFSDLPAKCRKVEGNVGWIVKTP